MVRRRLICRLGNIEIDLSILDIVGHCHSPFLRIWQQRKCLCYSGSDKAVDPGSLFYNRGNGDFHQEVISMQWHSDDFYSSDVNRM